MAAARCRAVPTTNLFGPTGCPPSSTDLQSGWALSSDIHSHILNGSSVPWSGRAGALGKRLNASSPNDCPFPNPVLSRRYPFERQKSSSRMVCCGQRGRWAGKPDAEAWPPCLDRMIRCWPCSDSTMSFVSASLVGSSTTGLDMSDF